MQTKLAQVLYREQKIAYILVDANFQLIEQCGENSLFAAGERPTHLLEAVPELEGCEDILADILNGEVPRFDLENINRISATGETLYINISVLGSAFTKSSIGYVVRHHRFDQHSTHLDAATQ